MLPLRTDIRYVAADGKMTQAGVEAIQGQLDEGSTATTALTTRVATIEAGTIAASLIRLQAAVAASGQTSIDRTGIPSWANRVTITPSLLSTSGTSDILIQMGNGSFVTSGYVCNYQGFTGAATGLLTSTAGFIIDVDAAANQQSGTITLTRQSGNTWVATGGIRRNGSSSGVLAGEIALAGALDRVRVTTVIGTDTFDAGSVSFSWE